ncbi:putative protein kinase ISR1 NDAI_0A04810 [Naumovozyma dairenensis CBS 421]|uniref:Protein kinase domain-containing protein n=1 Tax=Naumovozyma dairenensis (strain ATCC 10597 / BCRC 20456 / CBS 421 / NBRC 0211 / NRRL Y-12639) TaxID=1071378 RepID=G0W499_NAUDC|nr:hypothetical protein NDAI_0A04810 [Naumovozyma dairenensis CBS 421]CCD22637.1 hypothetical protein NDAI_0A04810 [Naumovozyma dairenensis CBS 421]
MVMNPTTTPSLSPPELLSRQDYISSQSSSFPDLPYLINDFSRINISITIPSCQDTVETIKVLSRSQNNNFSDNNTYTDSFFLNQFAKQILSFENNTLLSASASASASESSQIIVDFLRDQNITIDRINSKKTIKITTQDNENIQLKINLINHGSFTQVYELTYQNLNNDKQLSSCIIKFPKNEKYSKFILNELLFYHYLHNNRLFPYQNIIYLKSSSSSSTFLPILILPKYTSTLYQFIQSIQKKNIQNNTCTNTTIQQSTNITEYKKLWMKLFKDLLLYLKLFNLKNVIHCDIKTSNIVLNERDIHDNNNFHYNDDTMIFHIIDLASSKILIPSNSNPNSNSNGSEVNNINIESTLEYCPPEIIENKFNYKFFSSQTDLYSMGLCLLSFITKFEPYQNLSFNDNNNDCNTDRITPQSNSNMTFIINTILKNNPIILNTMNLNQTYLSNWSQEISIIDDILIKRVTLDYLLNKYT